MSLKALPWRAMLLCAGLFGLVGPFVGGICAIAFGCTAGRCFDANGFFFDILPPAFYLAYLIGVVPALLTGLAMALQARSTQGGRTLLIRSVPTGAIVAALCFALRQIRESSLSNLLFGGGGALLLVAAIGAIASLACTWLALSSGVLRPAVLGGSA